MTISHKLDNQSGIDMEGKEAVFMKNEELDVFDRALLFLYTAALREAGIEAKLKVVKVPDEEKR